MININGIDLNLITVFESIYRNKNVSKASIELGLSQPSVSASLKRLREIVNDELFTRLSRGVKPTNRADELYLKLLPALKLIQDGFDQKVETDLTKYKKTYKIGVVDGFIYSMFPALLKILEKEAPLIKFIPTHYSQSKFTGQLKNGEFDFILGTIGYTDDTTGLFSQRLFKDRYCVISRVNHPKIRKKLTLKNYLECDHVITSFDGKMKSYIDEVLKKKNLSRTVKLSVANFLTVPFLVSSTNMIAAVSEVLAKSFKNNANIEIHKCPIKLDSFETHLFWHNSFEHDPAKKTIIDILLRVSTSA